MSQQKPILEHEKIQINSLESHWMPFTANREFKENPRLVVKSEGMYMWDHQGGKLIDGSSSLFNSALGHGRKDIVDAVYRQMQANDYTPHFQMGHPGSFALSQKLAEILPEPINHTFFCGSGSEAIDTAMKIVMAYHRANGQAQRNRYASRERAYHGVNIGGVSLSGMVKNRETFPHVVPGVVHMRHTWSEDQRFERGMPSSGVELAEDLQRFVDTYGGTTIAACIVEPVAGSTGVLVPPAGYLERLREICDANGIVLIFDEVICGFGRLGEAFGAQVFGVTPDIMTMAKAITNGVFPMGAVSVTDEIFETITNAAPENAIEFFHGYTYSAHPAGCAAALATLKIYEEEDIFARAKAMSSYFLDAVWSLKDHPLIYDIRGIGMVAGVEFTVDGAPGKRGTAAQRQLFWDGMHVKCTGDVAILAPAMNCERSHIDEIVDKLKTSLDKMVG